MSHDESSIGFSSCRKRLTALHKTNRSCQNFYATFLLLKLWQSRGLPRILGEKKRTQRTNDSTKVGKKHLEKDIPSTLSFRFFFPFKDFWMGFLILSKKPITQLISKKHKKSRSGEKFLLLRPRESSPLPSFGGQLDGARGLSKRASLSGEFSGSLWN